MILVYGDVIADIYVDETDYDIAGIAATDLRDDVERVIEVQTRSELGAWPSLFDDRFVVYTNEERTTYLGPRETAVDR